MKFSEATSGEHEDAGEEPQSRLGRRKLIVSALVIVVILVSAYYALSAYGGSVVQTTVVTGTITTVQLPSSTPGAPAAGNLGGPAPTPVPAIGGSSSLTYVVISVGSTSITQALACSSVRYTVGQTVKVADQLLRDGQHRYFPDVACRGQLSPFQSVSVSQTTNSSSSSH